MFQFVSDPVTVFYKIKVVHESAHGPPGRKEVKMKRLIDPDARPLPFVRFLYLKF